MHRLPVDGHDFIHNSVVGPDSCSGCGGWLHRFYRLERHQLSWWHLFLHVQGSKRAGHGQHFNCNGDHYVPGRFGPDGDFSGKQQTTTLSDYRWIIEEDQTFYIDPNCTTNPPTGTCPGAGGGALPLLGTTFHTSNMPFVAQGCTGPLSCESGQMMVDTTGVACTSTNVPAGCNPTFGQHINAVCDVGNGVCRPDTSGNGKTPVLPGAVALDPTKRYYLTGLPGDAANPFIAGNASPDCANPTTGKPTGTNCTICTVTDPDSTDPYRYGLPMLPVGKYVVEVVPPAGYEIVKEEDKNILIGDDFIAPVTQEFGGLGDILIIPDQASVASSQQYRGPGYNQNNAQNPTQSLGANPNKRHRARVRS